MTYCRKVDLGMFLVFTIFIVSFSYLFDRASYADLSPGHFEGYSDEILVVVGRRPITRSLVEAVMKVFNIEGFEEALEFTLNSFIIMNHMESSDFRISDSEVEEELSKIGRLSNLRKELASMGMTYDEYKDFIKAKKFADHIFVELVGGTFVTDQEMKKFYDQNEQEIRKMFERRFVYYQEVLSGERKSDPSEMIKLGWVTRGELKKVFDDAIFSIPSTGFSSCVTADGSTFLFFVLDIYQPTFEELKDNIDFREFYVKSRYKEVFNRWLESMKAKQEIRRKRKTSTR